ncbi:hypothetical protein [Tumebacillus flagellatus]|uniref:Uncharacterized protein n=1 Tax=Tumebacillus flagellatus TaxID=1157490 RepID=A0A074LU40_9BACL|nr:hypothetical protein [Tumebacillus flagellatus]KEO83423.1 hypothetical protein EL26_10645 [Tumebacillus flagellatus]
MLYRAIAERGVRRVAIVGIAKHAGKTTAMNTLLTEAAAAGRRLGVVSIGVDGERRDAIMGVPKPDVYVPAGALVASAGDVLNGGSAVLSVVGRTGFSSTLGDVYLARVERPGTVLLAGIRYAAQVQAVLGEFEKLGADLCFVDGAFDRMMAASPELTEGVVLATGAVVASTVEETARKSAFFVQRFALPVAEEPIGRLLDVAVEHGGLVVGCPRTRAGEGSVLDADVDPGSAAGSGAGSDEAWEPVVLEQVSSFVANPLTDAKWPGAEQARVLAVSGAVTDRLLGMLEGLPRGFTVVLPDATHFFASAQAWRKFLRRGHRVMVRRAVQVLGLTVNPHSVSGYDLPRAELLAAVQEAVGGELTVVDVQGEEA